MAALQRGGAVRRAAWRCAWRASPAAAVTVRTYIPDTLSWKAEHAANRGALDTPFYLLDDKAQPVSPWHDIPLRRSEVDAPSDVFNFVCEIPRGTRSKFEIATARRFNPICYDTTKDGKPRLYAFQSLVNYGALPQTYEDPTVPDGRTGQPGDGDPLDVVEIGTETVAQTGSIYPVRVLGALAMLDGGETDWKIVAIRTSDPLAATLHDIAAAPDSIHRLLDDIRTWFATYKVPEGKGVNSFAFGGQWQSKSTALAVIAECHDQWKRLVAKRQVERAANPSGEVFGEEAALQLMKPSVWCWAAGEKRSAMGMTAVEHSLATLRVDRKHHLL